MVGELGQLGRSMLGWAGTSPTPLPEVDVQCTLERLLLRKDNSAIKGSVTAPSSLSKALGSSPVVLITAFLLESYSVSLELTQVATIFKKGRDTLV